jgi:hypothetical protein
LEIHICWKVDRDARMEPPIHTEYLRSGGATILIFIDWGARALISYAEATQQHSTEAKVSGCLEGERIEKCGCYTSVTNLLHARVDPFKHVVEQTAARQLQCRMEG